MCNELYVWISYYRNDKKSQVGFAKKAIFQLTITGRQGANLKFAIVIIIIRIIYSVLNYKEITILHIRRFFMSKK